MRTYRSNTNLDNLLRNELGRTNQIMTASDIVMQIRDEKEVRVNTFIICPFVYICICQFVYIYDLSICLHFGSVKLFRFNC